MYRQSKTHESHISDTVSAKLKCKKAGQRRSPKYVFQTYYTGWAFNITVVRRNTHNFDPFFIGVVSFKVEVVRYAAVK
jgi:hypothetical protein